MKKILFIIIFSLFFSGSAFAKKRVCIGVHKDYMNVETPIVLAKRNMIMEVRDCYEGNRWNQRYLYDVYGFYKKDEIFKTLYPIITKDGNNGWDKWTLDKFEIILGKDQYKFFNLPTSVERKLIADKKEKENKKIKQKKSIIKKDTKKKDPPKKTKPLGGPRENAERVAALKFYKIECGKLSYDGNVMLNEQERNMDQGVYRATQRKLSDLVLVEGIDRTCNMLYGVLNPQGLTN